MNQPLLFKNPCSMSEDFTGQFHGQQILSVVFLFEIANTNTTLSP